MTANHYWYSNSWTGTLWGLCEITYSGWSDGDSFAWWWCKFFHRMSYFSIRDRSSRSSQSWIVWMAYHIWSVVMFQGTIRDSTIGFRVGAYFLSVRYDHFCASFLEISLQAFSNPLEFRDPFNSRNFFSTTFLLMFFNFILHRTNQDSKIYHI